jgi:hypothetical protein
MKCYFYGSVFDGDPLIRKIGLISFAIPDFGIIYRGRWLGDLIECQYAALLALFKFAEHNDELFNNRKIEIYSDSSVVIYQLTRDSFVLRHIEPYYRLVQSYHERIPAKFRWLPVDDNPACHGLTGTPPIDPKINIKYDLKDKSGIGNPGNLAG